METEKQEGIKFKGWKRLFSAVIDPLVLLDLDGNIFTLNKEVAKLLDKCVDELIGRNSYDFMASNESRFLKAQINNIARLRNAIRVEKETFGKTFDHSLSPIFDEQGKIEKIAVFSHDITERKKIEKLLTMKSKGIEVSNNAIAFADLEGKLIYGNPMFLKEWGYKNVTEVIGKHATTFWHKEEETREVIKGLQNDGEWFGELVARRKNGKIFDVQASASLVIDDFGEPICLMGSFINITEKKEAEEKLRKSEEKYRLITENANDLIFILNKSMELEYINENVLKKLLGFSKKDIIGKPNKNFIFSEDIARTIKSFRKGLKSGQGMVELRCLDKSGLYHWFEIKGRTFINQDGKMKGLFIARDITKRKKREEELEKNYSELNQIFDIAIPLCVIDKNFNLIRINDSISSMFNVKPEEMIGRKCYDIVPGNLCNTPECTMKQIVGGKDRWGYEKEYSLRGGAKIVCNIRAVPYRAPNGEIIGVIQNYTDITERKKIEDMLKLSEERYSLATNAAKVGVWDWNRENGEFYLDPNIKMIMGYRDEEIRNDLIGWMKNIHPDDLKGAIKAVRAHLEGKTSEYNSELRKLHKDGSIRWIQVRGRAIRDTQGNAIRMVGTETDITAQKEAEVKLKISEAKLKILNKELEQKVEERTYELKTSEEKILNLINNISDVLMEGDVDGTITFVSPQIYDIIGYRPKDLIGIEFLELVHPDEKLTYEKLINIKPKAEDIFSMELRISHKEGYYVPISTKGSVVEINNKLKIFFVLRDITEKRKIDEMMKSEIEKLQDLDQIRSDLIRRISHELKTPLNSIFKGTQYLLDHSYDKVKDEIHSIIQLVNSGGIRLKSLIDNLILTYNIESKGLNLELKQTNLIPMIKNCVEDIVFRAKKRKIVIFIELLEELFTDVDKSMIKMAISNILSNSVKNTPPNNKIFVSTFEHSKYIDIIVKDDGVGLTKKEKLLLFKKFGKIERYGKGMDVDIEGAGLGLYIANEIVKLHHGEIVVNSKGRNMGSEFIIRLPIN